MSSSKQANQCSCSEPGFCSRRNSIVPLVHWIKCQQGAVLTLDQLYEKAKSQSSSRASAAEPEYITTSLIGQALADIIKRETGEELHCNACKQEVLRLNSLLPEQVLQDKTAIVDGIIERGRKLLGWWNPKRWAIDLAPAQVRARIDKWLDEAVLVGGQAKSNELNALSKINQSALAAMNFSASPIAEDRKKLCSEDSLIASGTLTHIRRSEVLQLRKQWRAEGFELPPLQLPRNAKFRGKKISRGLTHRLGHWSNAFEHTCIYFGRFQDAYGCDCNASRKVSVHKCNHPNNTPNCCLSDSDLARIHNPEERNSTSSCESCSLKVMLPRFITSNQYVDDIKKLATMVPSDVTRIVGISRSGLFAATMVSMLLHLPMDIVRQEQGDIVPGGNGWRLREGAPIQSGAILVIDDTCMTGNSLRTIRELVRQHFDTNQVYFATVYVNPLALAKPDFWVVDLPWPHILEWNIFNSVLLPACALDFDGILCNDCPPGHDDDGTLYEQFLLNARPLYPVRRQPIPMIVTARLEKYRPQTIAWLDKWRIRTDELVMGPWESLEQRNCSDVAGFKAAHYSRFMERRVGPGPHLFIESDERQAERIAKLSRGIVVCPAAGRCFQG